MAIERAPSIGQGGGHLLRGFRPSGGGRKQDYRKIKKELSLEKIYSKRMCKGVQTVVVLQENKKRESLGKVDDLVMASREERLPTSSSNLGLVCPGLWLWLLAGGGKATGGGRFQAGKTVRGARVSSVAGRVACAPGVSGKVDSFR
jgi:hypothetical protein